MSNLFKKLETVSTINNIKDSLVVTPEIEQQIIFGDSVLPKLLEEYDYYKIPRYDGPFKNKRPESEDDRKLKELQAEYDRMIDSYREIEARSISAYKRSILNAKLSSDKETKIQKAEFALQKAIISVFDDIDALNSQSKFKDVKKTYKTDFSDFYQYRNIGL